MRIIAEVNLFLKNLINKCKNNHLIKNYGKADIIKKLLNIIKFKSKYIKYINKKPKNELRQISR